MRSLFYYCIPVFWLNQISDPDVGPFPSTRAQLKAPGFPGGGAFSDVLTPDLARALLGNEVGRKILPNLPLPIWTLWGTSSFHVKNHQISDIGFCWWNLQNRRQHQANGEEWGSIQFLLLTTMAPLPCTASMQDWLCYKAQVYFVKADHNSMGFLDIWLERMSTNLV